MQATTVLTGVNVLLLLSLLYVHYKSFAKIKSAFTAGLALFAVLFLAQNLVSLYYYAASMPYYVNAVEAHAFILALLQATAFSVMNWLAWK